MSPRRCLIVLLTTLQPLTKSAIELYILKTNPHNILFMKFHVGQYQNSWLITQPTMVKFLLFFHSQQGKLLLVLLHLIDKLQE